MFLPKPEESKFELVPAGTFTAICYRFVDLGTQKSEYMGTTKFQRKVMISWELCGELMDDGRPFAVSNRYTWSMFEKAALRKDLESWRGLAFSESDFDGPKAFNVKNLLGVPCTLTITHTPKGDKTYSNISGIGKVMKGMQVPACINSYIYFALTEDEFDPTVFAGLSDRLKATIASSPEYIELMNGMNDNQDHPDGPRPFAPTDDFDDIPF